MIGPEDTEIINVFLNVLKNAQIVLDKNNPATERCFRRGFVHTEINPNRDVVCVNHCETASQVLSDMPTFPVHQGCFAVHLMK